MKRLLIVHTADDHPILDESAEGTDVTITHNLSDVPELLRIRYDFDAENWAKKNPVPGVPAHQYAHARWQERRREAKIATKSPYWDAVIFFTKSNDRNELNATIGHSVVAALAGCEYIEIVEYSHIDLDLVPKPGYSGALLEFDIFGTRVSVSRGRDSSAIRWIWRLRYLLLERKGYDGIIDEHGRVRSSFKGKLPIIFLGEFLDEVWPGLPSKIRYWEE